MKKEKNVKEQIKQLESERREYENKKNMFSRELNRVYKEFVGGLLNIHWKF